MLIGCCNSVALKFLMRLGWGRRSVSKLSTILVYKHLRNFKVKNIVGEENVKSVVILPKTQVGKCRFSCEYVKHSLFLYYYLLIIVLFSVWTTVNLLYPTLNVKWLHSYESSTRNCAISITWEKRILKLEK